MKKKFAAVYGTSIYAYLKAYRLQEAQKKLLRTDLSVADIACAVGYENPAKFSSAFKDECGMTPAQFGKYDSDKNAYWLAAGISTDCTESDISSCIDLFCTENLSE